MAENLLTLEEARDWVLQRCPAPDPVMVPIEDTLGLLLAADAISSEQVPPFSNTAMDGFAVIAADTTGAAETTPTNLTIVRTLAAGAPPGDVPLKSGEAIRIMTGAPMPPGADSVVPVEQTDLADEHTVRIKKAATAGDCVRPAGEDLDRGQLAFPAGSRLEAGHLGVLASIGLHEVSVWRRPRVGVISTGDELVQAPTPLGPGQIRDSNRLTLIGLVEEAGFEAVNLGVVRDDEAEIEARLVDGLTKCDALVTSGGVSMGDFDFIKVVLQKLSSDADPTATDQSNKMRWMQIAIKPAKPLAFGIVHGKPVFGLPGNPVSCMVSFELFARPALRRMMGYDMHPEGPLRREYPAIAPDGLQRGPDGKTHLVRVQTTMNDAGRLEVRALRGQASNLLRSMALANGLAVVPNGNGIAPGGETKVLLLNELA
jgi:molybdopterin molybdotransferase